MIAVHNLRKIYAGDVHAVNGIDFDVAAGEVFGLLGPNGAGKTTTIGMLTTALTPTSGSAFVAGHDVVTESLAVRRACGAVFQDAVVDRSLTGRRNLAIHGRLWGVERAVLMQRIAELEQPFGLGGLLDRPVSGYSGGQRRRLEIARALLSRPEVLFLDEPTVGLDPRIRHELLDVIAGLRHDHDSSTILLTTHYLDEAERLCDRVAVMHEGNIVAIGTPTELKQHLGDEVLEIRLAADAAKTLATLQHDGVETRAAFAVGTTLTVPLEGRNSRSVLDALESRRLGVEAVTTRKPTLDDVYLQLTGSTLAAA